MHNWITGRLVEQRRRNRATHPPQHRRRRRRAGGRSRRSRWIDRVVPAESRAPRARRP